MWPVTDGGNEWPKASRQTTAISKRTCRSGWIDMSGLSAWLASIGKTVDYKAFGTVTAETSGYHNGQSVSDLLSPDKFDCVLLMLFSMKRERTLTEDKLCFLSNLPNMISSLRQCRWSWPATNTMTVLSVTEIDSEVCRCACSSLLTLLKLIVSFFNVFCQYCPQA